MVLYNSLGVIHSRVYAHYDRGADLLAALLLFLILSISRAVVGDCDYQMIEKLFLGLLLCHLVASDCRYSGGRRDS